MSRGLWSQAVVSKLDDVLPFLKFQFDRKKLGWCFMKYLLAINWIIDHHAPYIAQCNNCRAFDPLQSVLKRLSFLFAVIDGFRMSSQSPNAKASGAGVGGGSTPGHLSGHHQQPSPATMPAPALQQQQQVWPLAHFIYVSFLQKNHWFAWRANQWPLVGQ